MGKLFEDLDVYAYRRGWPKWASVFIPLFYTVTWPIIIYRLNYFIYHKVKIPVLRQLLQVIGFILSRIISTVTTVEISEKAHIGKGFFIAHFGDIVISHHSIIGDYCSIHQGVTIGGAGRGEDYGNPRIGNRVYLAAGAKVIGKVTIGDDVMTGCNAVITKDIPAKKTVGGIPARILNEKGSIGFIHYRGVNER